MLEFDLEAVGVIVTAAVSGGVGGFGYELLLVRQGETGTVERPRKLDAEHYDIGWTASVFLGAVAAVALLYFFPPTVNISVGVSGSPTSDVIYDPIAIIALSLIVGTSATAFLSAMQQRALAAVAAKEVESSKKEVETTREVAKAQLESLQRLAETNTADAAQAAAAETRRSIIDELRLALATAPAVGGGAAASGESAADAGEVQAPSIVVSPGAESESPREETLLLMPTLGFGGTAGPVWLNRQDDAMLRLLDADTALPEGFVNDYNARLIAGVADAKNVIDAVHPNPPV